MSETIPLSNIDSDNESSDNESSDDIDFSTITPWNTVKSFQDLQKCMTMYINGELNGFPGNFGPLHSETKVLIPYILKLIDNGFVTTISQPGLYDDDIKQREWVEGYCSRSLAMNIIKSLSAYDCGIILFELTGGGKIYKNIDKMKMTNYKGQHIDVTLEYNPETKKWESFTRVPLYVKKFKYNSTYYVIDNSIINQMNKLIDLLDKNEITKNDLVYLSIIAKKYGPDNFSSITKKYESGKLFEHILNTFVI